MQVPFGRLMELVAELPDDDPTTLGQLAQRWGEPSRRIADAVDAVKVLNGEPSYVGVEHDDERVAGLDLAAIRARHRPDAFGDMPVCRHSRLTALWPCDAHDLLAAMARAEAFVADLIGYCNWHQGTPGSRFSESNVRALAHKIRAALAGADADEVSGVRLETVPPGTAEFVRGIVDRDWSQVREVHIPLEDDEDDLDLVAIRSALARVRAYAETHADWCCAKGCTVPADRCDETCNCEAGAILAALDGTDPPPSTGHRAALGGPPAEPPAGDLDAYGRPRHPNDPDGAKAAHHLATCEEPFCRARREERRSDWGDPVHVAAPTAETAP